MRYLSILLVLFLSFACTPPKPEHFNDDKSLFEYANKLFDDESYDESVTFYESLRNRYPQSPHIAQSTLRIADARFETGAYLEAESSYQMFRSLHPSHPKTPYVVYRIALCNFKQIPKGQGRDQAFTERALAALQELTSRWPQSPEATEAQALIKACRRNLALRELYVAKFYMKRKKYNAALVRLVPLSSDSEFSDIQEEAMKYREKAERRATP